MSDRQKPIHGANGRPVDSEGIHWETRLGIQVMRRLIFVKRIDRRDGPDRFGRQTKLPKKPVVPEDTSWWDDPKNCTNGL